MDYLQLDLEGHRCPDVMQRIRKALNAFLDQDVEYLVITTIEPSAERDVRVLIGKEHPDTVSLVEVQTRPLTEQRMGVILNSESGFMPEDIGDMGEEFVMLVSRA